MRPYDFYRTPEWCYKLLDGYIKWDNVGSALEPCEGDGRITNWIRSKGVACNSYDIQDKLKPTDYLKVNTPERYDLILTNPPFTYAQQFIEKARKESDCVIMLLRLSILGSQQRHTFWKLNLITGLYVLSKRPSFTRTGTDNSEYAWFVWDYTSRIAVRGIQHLL